MCKSKNKIIKFISIDKNEIERIWKVKKKREKKNSTSEEVE